MKNKKTPITGAYCELKNKRPDIQELSDFLVEYATTMIGVGTYSARVNRCISRIATTYGYEVSTGFLFNHTYITITDKKDHSIRRTYIANNKSLGVNFRIILRLSALSWSIYDHGYNLSFAKRYFKKSISKVARKTSHTIMLVSVANAAFCHVFGGDIKAVVLIFFTTLLGTIVRAFLHNKKVDMRFIYIICSFLSSFGAEFGSGLIATQTTASALSASTLYLVPGVFFINVTIDVLKNNILMGISRLVNVSILIICIAMGIYMTLTISNYGVL